MRGLFIKALVDFYDFVIFLMHPVYSNVQVPIFRVVMQADQVLMAFKAAVFYENSGGFAGLFRRRQLIRFPAQYPVVDWVF